MNIRTSVFASSVVVALLASGCVSADQEAQPPQQTTSSEQALDLTKQTPDEVAGTYVVDGVQLTFRLRREGEARFATLSARAGQPFVESTYRDGIDEVRVLGGKLVERGNVHEDARLEGDSAALDQMLAMPEAKLVAPLKDALADAGVDPFFIGREPKEAARGGVQPTAYYDGSSWHLNYWESASFATWSFWGWTTVTMEAYGGNPNSRACLELSVSGCPEYMCTDYTYYGGNGPRSVQRQWGGARLYVRNTGLYSRYQCGGYSTMGWPCNGGSCNNRTIKVRTN